MLEDEGIKLKEESHELALFFRNLAERQLRGKALTKDEEFFILLYGNLLRNRLHHMLNKLDRRGCVAFARTLPPLEPVVRWAGKDCAEILVIAEHNGKSYLYRGGVLDYREFDLPSGRALTREEFRRLMDSADAPPWTASYRSGAQ